MCIKRKHIIILSIIIVIPLIIIGCNTNSNPTNNSLSLQMIDSANEMIYNINSDAIIIWVGGKRTDNQLLTNPSET